MRPKLLTQSGAPHCRLRRANIPHQKLRIKHGICRTTNWNGLVPKFALHQSVANPHKTARSLSMIKVFTFQNDSPKWLVKVTMDASSSESVMDKLLTFKSKLIYCRFQSPPPADIMCKKAVVQQSQPLQTQSHRHADDDTVISATEKAFKVCCPGHILWQNLKVATKCKLSYDHGHPRWLWKSNPHCKGHEVRLQNQKRTKSNTTLTK